MTLSIRMTVAIVVLVAATTVGILYFTNKTLEDIINARALVQLETHARLIASKLEDRIDDVKNDVVILAPTASLDEFIRLRMNQGQSQGGDLTKVPSQERIITFIKAKLATNRSYLNFNIVGVADGGREILRVDRLGPERTRRLAPIDELRRLGDTELFQAAVKLKPGEIYVSPILFNGDSDAEGMSAGPVMQVATPIFAHDGSLFGLIAITTDATEILNSVRSISLSGDSAGGDQVYVVNNRGEYLVQPDFARKLDGTIDSAGDDDDDDDDVDNHFSLARILGTNQSKTFMLRSSSGERLGVAIAPVNPGQGAWFGVIVTLAHTTITAPILAIQRASIYAGLVGVLVAIVLAMILARSIAKPLVQMARAVDAFKPGMAVLMPAKALKASGEVGVLARAFEHMAVEVTDKNEELRCKSEHREQMKDEFIAMVSHELRTPLTSIAASLGLLIADPAGTLSDPAKRLLRIAHSNSQRLVRLINDILDIEKIESGKVEFRVSRLNVRPLLQQAIESNRGFADQLEVTLRLDPASIDAIVRADVDRLTQVITNLLSNAVKYSPQGSEVLVTTEHVGTNVRIGVRDHGAGIPEEFRARVFEKFAQADSVDVRQKGGTGLGLSIVKQIIVKLGGDVGFKAAPGGGTIFHVDLPRYDTDAAAAIDWADGAQLLLCGDDAVAAAQLCEELHRAGFNFDVALTAEDAVRGSATRSYAAIVVDLQLPESDGVALIKQLRSQWHLQNTPVIVVSVDLKLLQRKPPGAILSAMDWLTKPLDVERLMRILNRPVIRDAHPRPRILHFDGDREVLRLTADTLKQESDVFSADTIEKARRALAEKVFDLAVIEVSFNSHESGVDILPDLRDKNDLAIPTILYSVPNSPEIAVAVLATLAKAPTPIESLVANLRRLVVSTSVRAPKMKEVA